MVQTGSLPVATRTTYLTNNTAHIRAAGVTTNFNETAKDALNWQARPETPTDIKKYRQSVLHETGKVVRHWGVADDPLPQGPFGKSTEVGLGDTTGDLTKTYPTSEIAQWKLQTAEEVYASATREPLGRSYVRGHNIPDGLGTERPFGKLIDARELERSNQARTVVFSPENPSAFEEDSQAMQLYVRSHGAYGPGEQRHRNYDWAKAGVDPNSHTFGARDKDETHNGVAKLLNAVHDEKATFCFPLNYWQQETKHAVVAILQVVPKLVPKVLEDYRLTAADMLGKTRPVGAGDRSLPQDFTFGAPSMRFPEPGVEQLLHGSYTPDEQQPDADLGKSLREGWRNVAPDDRVFGAPSIRVDIPIPQFRSVSSTVNYGNEPDALQLLRPPKSAERGVNEQHYLQLRSKEEISALSSQAQMSFEDGELDTLFSMACQRDGCEDRCCLDSFMKARQYLTQRVNGL